MWSVQESWRWFEVHTCRRRFSEDIEKSLLIDRLPKIPPTVHTIAHPVLQARPRASEGGDRALDLGSSVLDQCGLHFGVNLPGSFVAAHVIVKSMLGDPLSCALITCLTDQLLAVEVTAIEPFGGECKRRRRRISGQAASESGKPRGTYIVLHEWVAIVPNESHSA